MTIHLSPTHSGVIQHPSDRPGSSTSVRPLSPDTWMEFAEAVRHEISSTASSIVSISDKGRNAAQSSESVSPSPLPQTEADAVRPESDGNADISLDQLMVEMLSAQKILGVSAADLQAVRSSAANSDLQLRAIEDAATRAGFALERHIRQTRSGVEESTFQPRGVILDTDGK